MSIDLYFIGNCKEFMSYPKVYPVSYGWGVRQDGTLRCPKEHDSSLPIVIDDSITAIPSDEAIRTLLSSCRSGCILDLEKPLTKFHLVLLEGLKKAKIEPLWLPQKYTGYSATAYCMLSCEFPHNSWKSFCEAQSRRYQKGWALEYHPIWMETRNIPPLVTGKRYLSEAICMTDVRGNSIIYYDTVQTIMEKRKIAAHYGCQGIISIAEEWKGLSKK